MCKFHAESIGKRILKIGLQLPKLWAKDWAHGFALLTVYVCSILCVSAYLNSCCLIKQKVDKIQ